VSLVRLQLALSIALGAVSSSAHAQLAGPYSPSVYNEGPGVRLGGTALTLHPGIALEGGYDTNVFYSPSDPVGSALLRIRAHLDMATLPAQAFANDTSTADPKVDFRFSTQVEYREYLSSNPNAQAQRSVNVGVGADLGILPHGPFTLRISDLFVRTVDPQNNENPNNFTRDFNRIGLLASYKVGGLEFGGGDFFQFNLWETKTVQFGDSISDEGQLFARLRILSQTLLSLVARMGWTHYTNDPAIDSTPLRILAGGQSLFTSWFGASAEVGYGNSLNKMGPSFNSALAKIEARFFLPHGARIVAAYDRDFSDSVFANLYVDDHLFVLFEQPIVRRVSAHIDGGVRFRHYEGLADANLLAMNAVPGAIVSYNMPTRDDRIYDARAELAVRCTDWLQVGASYNLQIDDTPFEILTMDNMGNTTSVRAMSYIKHSVFGRVDIAY
jgi:hypothetical protein